MNGAQFIKLVRCVGKKNGVEVRFDGRHGKGSHGRLYYGERFTTLKDRRKEISPCLYRKMLRDL